MSHRMQRRAFLIEGSRAALGVSVLPLVARAQGNPRSASWESLISDLEKQNPKQMEENLLPGLSIAIIKNGKLGWSKGFGVKDSVSKEPVDTGTIFEAASIEQAGVCLCRHEAV